MSARTTTSEADVPEPSHARESGALLGPFGTAPPLSLWAMGAALASLALNRVAIRTLADDVPHSVVVSLNRWFALPRNLAAIAGVVALTGAVYDFLRRRGVAPLWRRVGVAGFAGVFLPTTVFATLLPAERTTASIVMFGAGAASVLAVMVALVAVRWQGPLGLRTATSLFAASAFLSLGALLAHTLLPSGMWQASLYVGKVLRGAGEVTYLLAPLAAVPSIRPLYPPRRARIGKIVGAAIGVAVLGILAWGRYALRGDFPTILYGAQRLELLADSVPLLYAFPLAVGFGIGTAALCSGAPADRQAGTGLLLLLAAGYGPKAPAQLMMMVLGLTLLARTLIAQASAIQESRAHAEV